MIFLAMKELCLDMVQRPTVIILFSLFPAVREESKVVGGRCAVDSKGCGELLTPTAQGGKAGGSQASSPI
jgi:hypothetical protein